MANQNLFNYLINKAIAAKKMHFPIKRVRWKILMIRMTNIKIIPKFIIFFNQLYFRKNSINKRKIKNYRKFSKKIKLTKIRHLKSKEINKANNKMFSNLSIRKKISFLITLPTAKQIKIKT